MLLYWSLIGYLFQETKAELQYSQALQCIARDQLNEAEEQLYHLLHSEIICSVSTINTNSSEYCI